MMSMRLENASILEQFAGQFHCFSDGFHWDFAAPGPDNPFPRRAEGNLLQNLEDHDARSLERRFAMADWRISDDVFAEFDSFAIIVCFRFHVSAIHCARPTTDLQARHRLVASEI